jgi:hypothetical protein
MHRHPNVSAWNREEDGSYQSEVEGWALHVTWRPEPKDPGERRGFLWTASAPDGRKLESTHVEEEIEVAMSKAEDAARRSPVG